jgi:DNA repair protein RadC
MEASPDTNLRFLKTPQAILNNGCTPSSNGMIDYKHQPTPTCRVMEGGPQLLSDFELLVTIVGSLSVASILLDKFGSIENLIAVESAHELKSDGVTEEEAARVVAVKEMWQRVSESSYRKCPILTPEDVYSLMEPRMSRQAYESVSVLTLTRRKMLVRVHEVFKGSSSECLAAPAEIIKAALADSACAIVLTHNHPSGDPAPSTNDKSVTNTISSACRTMGIELADHVIVGRSGPWGPPFFSFRENGLM